MAKRRGVDLRISRQMLQIGVMCTRLRRFETAERIIRAVKDFRDDLPHPGTTLGMALLSQGRSQEAIEELEAVVAAYPNHQLGKVFLGLAYHDAGRGGWELLLQEVIEDGRDEWAIELAQQSLDFDYRPLSERRASQDPAPLPGPGQYA